MSARRVRQAAFRAAVCIGAAGCGVPAPGPVRPANAGGGQVEAGEVEPVLAATRAWWRAYTVGDTARVAALTAPEFVVTLSGAQRVDRAAALQDASARGDSSLVRLEWSDEDARIVGGTAVVRSRLEEWIGRSVVRYEYLSVLDRRAGGWRLVAAQSTRIPERGVPVRVSVDELRAYAGRYRIPSGAAIEFTVRDSLLLVTEPGGGPTRPLVAVGPAVFEFDAQILRRSGLIRFVFERDERGRVASVSRIAANGVLRFPRLP
jgi:hypothetical protein